jgi:CBS domain-containing protein
MSDMAVGALPELRVSDAMHPGLISCSPQTPLRTVARMMSTNRVHAILVTTHGKEEGPRHSRWGIVESSDVLRATAGDEFGSTSAGSIMTSPVPIVAADDDLGLAITRIVENDVSHVLVTERLSDRPLGVLSALDVARASAGFPERHPPSGWRKRARLPQHADA